MPRALDVLFPLPVPAFRYLAPYDDPEGPLGARVAVPWQGGWRVGVVVGAADVRGSAALELREAIAWLDRRPFLHPAAPALIEELAAYCGAPPGVVLAGLAPTGLRPEGRHELRAVAGAEGVALPADRWTPAERLAAAELDLYRKQGLVLERVLPVEPTVRRLVPLRPADAALDGAPRANQRRALARLQELEAADSAAALARDADVPESAVRALVSKGYAAYEERPAPPPPLPGYPAGAPLPAPLADPPEGAATAITGGLRRDRLATVLPQLRAHLARGESVLVLVPEGAFLEEAAAWLAPQLPVRTLSGELDDRQRARVWAELQEGGPALLLGTYLALLAPLERLGRIVVLEAGSGSYKLPSGARLFVPAAAERLARASGAALTLCDVLLTPEMALAAPPEARRALPVVRQRLHVSDLSAGGWPLGADLAQVLRQVRDRGRQAVLLSPRRGFSAALGCEACGHVMECPHCDLPLRFHREERRLRCHQCGHAEPPPDACPECGAAALMPLRGAGTQWIASAVRRLLGDFPVHRFDRDQRDDLAPLHAGEPGVLVATTAVLRQPPLPDVALLAVTLLDTHLSLSDFRAEEEALRFLLQLPELAPERRPLTLLQTFQPEHALLEALRADDLDAALEGFVERTLERRRAFGYPPHAHLGKVQVSARDRASAAGVAERVAGALRAAGAAEEEVLGPTPAPVARLRGQVVYQVFVRAREEARFLELLASVPARGAGAKVRVDVDPRDVVEFLE